MDAGIWDSEEVDSGTPTDVAAIQDDTPGAFLDAEPALQPEAARIVVDAQPDQQPDMPLVVVDAQPRQQPEGETSSP